MCRQSKLMVSLAGLFLFSFVFAAGAAEPVKYCRFQAGDTIAYGIVEGNVVRELSGDLFGEFKKTDKTHPLKNVKLLVPSTPSHVFAMAGNYKSHLGKEKTITTTITTVTTITTNTETKETKSESKSTTETRSSGEVPEKFQIPQPFIKTPSCLQAHEGKIVLPADAETVHYEAETVIVIGKTASNVSKESALDYVLGVTCGNDVSARVWQRNDVQWWRAKGSDTFGPCGPFILAGVDYDNLELELILNGECKQKENTKQLIHGTAEIVSFISRHVTLQPGDLIFTGTPGETADLKDGDEVEVRISYGKGAGQNIVLTNKVVAE